MTMYNVRMHVLVFMKLCFILLKNPINALTYVNTTLFTLLHCYMFQTSTVHPQGVLTQFVSMVNKMRVQM